ncbi:bifunctional 3-phosphoshikimate 1-carboxyvinyltransferase/cytidylate kinase [Pseudorhodoferax sp. Leaf274]|uniref:bifunctional 3-phosphoshikimate 1-carboxyvinyltransferase/cytidylate kinase n=1 Tax=Pseudorhodoferax sp. Leaf274 TaxID=1736318 RepID=UPI0007033F41|nr:bifunctional 3-phosphoshikimate 1-carboxyvinyltransferase/cytidylate kinase [Pseudorhodoferax sp. Leaf274]KQP43133.1 cytidylate kinase [Pseudorhodoferax sp. Leaf274]
MFDTAFLDLPPLQGAAGTVALPGSKSISNRVLLLAALSAGQTTVRDLLDSDDTRVMLAALAQLGCAIAREGNSVTITGLDGKLGTAEAELFMGNAGTAIRPLTAVLALLGGNFTLTGVPRMYERPIGDLVDALVQLGCAIGYGANPGYPPLQIGMPGALQLDQPIRVRGDVSSQFLTALLLALPLVARRDITVEVVGELISKPYVEITLNLLARFGIAVAREGWQRFTIPAGSRYQSPGEIHVEADASSASYFVALGAIAAAAGEPLRIEGVGAASIQGDIRFVEAAQAMGAAVEAGPNWLSVARGAWPLKAIDLDCNHIPDAAMTLAVMALYADGPSRLHNIASWRVKETDRIAAMAAELRKFGAEVEEGQDYLRIVPPPLAAPWPSAAIHTYDDHRVAMCFSLAAFHRLRPGAAVSRSPVRILDPRCVAKTFPDYFETLLSVCRTPTAQVPVLCIDGPTASGKGTVAAAVARALGYHFLDSGAMYRITAFAAMRAGHAIGPDGEAAIARMAAALPVRFDDGRIWLDAEDVTDAIRTEEAGMNASKVSALPAVRAALVDLQLSFRRLPGLVADGRDMGTVIFPAAPLKVYLTASAERRAERRHKQLISKGISTTIADLRADLEARDARDSSRAVAPLRAAADALTLDNSDLTVQACVDRVLAWWDQRQGF